ncbi:hypothetical protein [Streptomyces dysideae]|nr:hypothetical protein [Streptomyces dysideae]
MASLSGRGCIRGFGVGVLLAGSFVDLASVTSTDVGILPVTIVVLLVGLSAVTWPAARRPAWLTPQLRTGLPALLSVLLSVGMLLSGASDVIRLAEA